MKLCAVNKYGGRDILVFFFKDFSHLTIEDPVLGRCRVIAHFLLAALWYLQINFSLYIIIIKTKKTIVLSMTQA